VFWSGLAPIQIRPLWGHRWGHATHTGALRDTLVPLNHAVVAQPSDIGWAVKDSNLRPWD